MELHLISYPLFFKDEVPLVQSLMSEHDFVFHLRKPDANDESLEAFLQQIPSEFHSRIMMHGAYDIVDKCNIKGLHFSEKNRFYQEKLNYRYSSSSCHSINELKKLDGQYSQMFISPVFSSISKPGYCTDFTLKELGSYLSGPRKSKIIALGGMDKTTIPQIKDTGFDGCAVLGAVWGENAYDAKLIEDNIKSIVQCIQQYLTV